MSDEEQLRILRQGVKGWNEWREENPDAEIDLSGAYLSRADLSGADLSGANLGEANLNGTILNSAFLCEANLISAFLQGANLNTADLHGAILRGANLREANLSGANLSSAFLFEANLNTANLHGANLSKAELQGAILRGADLREANLSKSHLIEANLVEAYLIRAKFSGARIGETVFANSDLSQTEGLETLNHFFPSTIGTDTLQLSKGKIPEKFLRGCGLSDWEVESAKLYRDGLLEKEVDDILYKIRDLRLHQAIQYYSVFISYSTKDQEFAQKLHDDLQNNGVRCWFAPADMQGGKKIHEQIDSAIRMQDRLLLVLSESSMNSEWVKTEIANARQKEVMENRQVLFPISLVDFERIQEWECFDSDRGKDSAREIREYFIPDFSNWQDEKPYRAGFERLLKDLRATEMVKGG